tara:strand:+ start:1092 stop:4256 length:3165 start_codon:yes stop_codon:yes gene_type:complete
MVSTLEEEKKKRLTEKEILFLDKLTQPNPYTGQFYNPIQDSSSRQNNLGIIQGLLDNDKIPNKDFSRNLFSEVYQPLLNQENISNRGPLTNFTGDALSSLLSLPGDVADIAYNVPFVYGSGQNLANIGISGFEGIRDIIADRNFTPRPPRIDRYNVPEKIDTSGQIKDFLFENLNIGSGSDPRNIGPDNYASAYGKNFGDFTKFSLGSQALLSRYGQGTKYFDDMYNAMITNPKMFMTSSVAGDLAASNIYTYAEKNDWGPTATMGAVLAASTVSMLPGGVVAGGKNTYNKIISGEGILGKLKGPFETLANFNNSMKLRLSSDPQAVQNLLASKLSRELAKNSDANIDDIIQKFVNEDIPKLNSMSDEELLKIVSREGQPYGVPARIADNEVLTAFNNWAAGNNQNFNNVLTSLINRNAKNVILPDDLKPVGDPTNFLTEVKTLFANQSKDFGDKFVKYLDDYEQILTKEFGFSPAEANTEIAKLIRKSYNQTVQAERNAWRQLDRREFMGIELPDDFFGPLINVRNRLGEQMQVSRDPVLPANINKELNAILSKVEAGEKITFGELKSFQSQLRKSMEGIKTGPLSKNADVYYNLSQLEKSLFENSDLFISNQGKEFGELLQQAKFHTYNKYETYERNPIIQKVMDKTNRGNYSLNDRYTAKTILDFDPRYLSEDINVIRNVLESAEENITKAYFGPPDKTGRLRQPQLTIDGDRAFQSIVGDLANVAVGKDGKINISNFYRWMKDNKDTIESFPRLKEIVEKYKGNFKALEDDLSANIFGLKPISRDPITGKISFDVDKKSAFYGLLETDNAVPIVQKAIFDSKNGGQKVDTIVEALKGDKNLAEGFKLTVYDSLIDDALNSARPILQINKRLNQTIGDKTLKEVLAKNKILTEKQMDHFETTLQNFVKDLDFTTLNLYQDRTTAMATSDALSAVFRGLGSKGFSKLMESATGKGGSGSSLIIAGRGSQIGQKLFGGLANNKRLNDLVIEVMLYPEKTRYILELVKGIETKSLSKLEAYKQYTRHFLAGQRSGQVTAREIPEWFSELYDNGD